MADEEIGTQPDRFPKDEKLEEIVGHHQHQHGEGKQGDVREKPGISWLPMHVADRINVDEAADDCHQQQHRCIQLIDV